jgi:NTP pyrophosphatase (non-canonical NTP hydrolase)
MERLESLLHRIDKFNKDRDWDQFHSPSNLSKSIAIESGELLECFQWNDDKYDIEEVKEELADVLNYCFQLANVLGIDPIDIVNAKMDITEKKYPVDKAKGVSTKYNKL